MKIMLCLLLGLFVGCSSPQMTGPVDTRLYGKFCHDSLDAAACLTFQADHTYTESFISAAAGISSRSLGSGRWQHKHDEVVMVPERGSRRVLKITEEKGALVLTEMKGDKVIRIYRQ